MSDVQQAALSLIAALLAAATPVVVAYVVRLLKSTLNAKQLALASSIAEQAVRVAEELGNQTGAPGQAKLAIAAKTFSSLAGGVKDLKGLDKEKVYDLLHSALVDFRLISEGLAPGSPGVEVEEPEVLALEAETETPVSAVEAGEGEGS